MRRDAPTPPNTLPTATTGAAYVNTNYSLVLMCEDKVSLALRFDPIKMCVCGVCVVWCGVWGVGSVWCVVWCVVCGVWCVVWCVVCVVCL